MAIQLTSGLWTLSSGSLTFVHNNANYGPVPEVVGAYCNHDDNAITRIVYRVVDGSVGYYQISMGVVTSGFTSTAEYEQAKVSGTHIPDEGVAIRFPILSSEVPIDMQGNKIVNGSEAVSPDGFVILSQLNAAIADLQANLDSGDQVNADAIAALTTIVNNLDLNGGLTEAQVTAIADARVAAGLLSQFDNATMQSLLDQLRSQLSAVDTVVINDVAALTAQMADLEPRVTATEAKNTQQDTRLAAIEAVDVAQAERMTTIEGVNSAQDAAIASLQAGLATEARINSAQAVQLQGHQTAITNLNAVTTPIVVELRNGIISSASGVPMNAVSIASSNDTHMTVTIDTNGRKNCETTFLRVVGGVGKKALCEEHRLGVNQDQYVFGIKKLVDGTSDATFLLSGGSFF